MGTHMATKNYTLFDNFELKGIWWLPETPDLQVTGTLKFENENDMSLDLLGTFREITTLGSGNIFQPEIILGISDNGKICTLFKNIEVQNQLNFPGIRKSKFRSNYLFIGKHFKNSEEVQFSSLQANFTNLENWLAVSPFSQEIPKDTRDEFRLTHNWPSEFIAELSGINCIIESTHEFNIGGDSIKKVLWESNAYLKITPYENKDFDWYWSLVYDLCNFLTLLIGDTIYIKRLKAIGDGEAAPGKNRRGTIEIFFTQKKYNPKENIHPFEMIIPFPRISEDVERVLSLWFAKAQQLRSVCYLFFGTFYNPSMYLQFQFLSLMQALESFHRVTKGGKYLSDVEWKPFREKLANAIPAELEASHRESLKSRIKYGNEYSLRKRISELLENLDEETLSRLSPTEKYFTGTIVDTRNYLTHYDDELKDVALKNADLYWAVQRLRILISILLLKEIGVQEKLILNSMMENNKIGQVLGK